MSEILTPYASAVISDLERQLAEKDKALAEAQHGIQDMETKLRNECQSHAITRKAWRSDKEQFIKAQAENKRLREALERIANQDYRGNRSTESTIAYEALKGGGK